MVLLPPGQVRRYVLRNKTDRTDTKGLLEADRNEEIVPVVSSLAKIPPCSRLKFPPPLTGRERDGNDD